MENILYRIEKIAHNEGIKITALERKIGASKGVLSRAIANGTDIQYKWVQKIVENYPQYSTNWLLTGKGEMLKLMSEGEIQQHDKEVADGKWHTGSVSQYIADSDEYQSLYNKYIVAVQELESKNNASAPEDKKNNDDKFSLNTLLKAINNLSEAALINANANLESAKASVVNANANLKNAEASMKNAEANERYGKNMEKMLNLLSIEDGFLEKKELCQEI